MGPGQPAGLVEIDFRVGGNWRFVESADGEQYAFRGEFREIDAPEFFTWTFEYEPMPGHVASRDRRSPRRTARPRSPASTFADQAEDRDGMLESGMEQGAEQSYAALDAYLNKIA